MGGRFSWGRPYGGMMATTGQGPQTHGQGTTRLRGGSSAKAKGVSRSEQMSFPDDERRQGDHVDLDCLPRLLGYNLRRAHQTSWRHYASVVGKSLPRPGLFSLLVLVRANPGIAQIELGTHLGVDKASVVALLDILEKASLVTRKRSTHDRRRQGVFLTAAGLMEVESLLVGVRAREKQMAGRYTKAEFEQFIEYLQRLYRP